MSGETAAKRPRHASGARDEQIRTHLEVAGKGKAADRRERYPFPCVCLFDTQGYRSLLPESGQRNVTGRS
jgi:hypothetical protein